MRPLDVSERQGADSRREPSFCSAFGLLSQPAWRRPLLAAHKYRRAVPECPPRTSPGPGGEAIQRLHRLPMLTISRAEDGHRTALLGRCRIRGGGRITPSGPPASRSRRARYPAFCHASARWSAARRRSAIRNAEPTPSDRYGAPLAVARCRTSTSARTCSTKSSSSSTRRGAGT